MLIYQAHPDQRSLYLLHRFHKLTKLTLSDDQQDRLPVDMMFWGKRFPFPNWPTHPVDDGYVHNSATNPKPKIHVKREATKLAPNSESSDRWPFRDDHAASQIALEIEAQLDRLEQESTDVAEIGTSRRELFKQLLREWHPDKKPGQEELATRIFQWLQSIRARYIGEMR
eukprot:gnl/TRDRNA2_/TRDRNA2_139333_c1_seq2.p1 gnl/TRDRNA2_/TRDRNA2_139333_c1~~gnl/TRDRNA2_/TRDRNA2_139333_c1_seq2.p1  ORF type:complete len:170 (-),score=11.85 gnl/TRDRNA2_/TRDRNA2_139333_c1_seq2:35-544(-)